MSEDVWVEDPARAARYVQTHEQLLNSERKPKHPPHWVRCEFVDQDGVRCFKGEGHHFNSTSPHEVPK